MKSVLKLIAITTLITWAAFAVQLAVLA